MVVAAAVRGARRAGSLCQAAASAVRWEGAMEAAAARRVGDQRACACMFVCFSDGS